MTSGFAVGKNIVSETVKRRGCATEAEAKAGSGCEEVNDVETCLCEGSYCNDAVVPIASLFATFAAAIAGRLIV